MAENAANFTATFQSKPSIFEVLAQKSLNETLHPALQKVALFLSTNFPRKFGFLYNYYDETFFVVNGLLQVYYLKYYDSSFSENFYGLKRVLVNSKPLTKHEKDLSLLFLVALPYFKRKIEDKLELYRIENAEGYLRNDFESKMKKFLIHSHSTLEVIWGLATLYNYLQYMANKTEHQLPILNVLNLKLAFSNDGISQSFWGALFSGKLRFSELNFGLVRSAVSTILETTAFFMQFLQTWNAQKPNFNIADLPKVDAPRNDNKIIAKGVCPICFDRWRIPTVLPVSGYIFCFLCIQRHLNETHKCPVTNLPARHLDLVRLYTNM